MARAPVLYAVMLLLGLCWGLTIPSLKFALGEGRQMLGIIAWEVMYMLAFITVILWLRRTPLPPLGRHWLLFVVVSLMGTLVSGIFSLMATERLPAGIMAILIAMVPMASLPIALALGLERWRARRMAGVVLGAVAVLLLAGPEASLPRPGDWVWVLVGLIAPLCYGIEGNYLAYRGTAGLDALQVLWGASLISTCLAVPAAVATGAWVSPLAPWGPAEWAVLVAAISHGIAYVGYVWLVGQAGSVFAAQVAYVVTGAGVLWSMALLGERYAGWVWVAFLVMLAGVALVQPRRGRRTVEPAAA